MKKLVLSGLACASLLALADYGYAHGGRYRGPGDVVPPNTGGGKAPSTPTPTTPGAPAPGAPAPAAPTTPGPAAPSAPSTPTPGAPSSGGGPTTGPRGTPIGDDLTKWQFWWEFNKDPFINLKDAIHRPETTTGSDDFFMGASRRVASSDTAKPSKVDIMETILPALKRALDSTDQRDITSSCIVAMAKIGEDHPKFKILPIFKKTLVSFDQEIRETAALAMGISQMEPAIEPLRHLVLDSAEGRKLVQKSFVDDRTRSFAAYGMGLISHASDDVKVKTATLETMAKILRDDSIVDRNIRVAAVNALGLLNPNRQNEADANGVLNKALSELDTFYNKKLGRGQELIQSHVPPAIAKLLGRGSEGRREAYKEQYCKELASTRKRANDIYRAAAIALGQLVQPEEVDKKDTKYSIALIDYFKKGKNPQARYFALMSLGQIGGIENKNYLLTVLRKGKKALERPWAALALGVYSFNIFEQDPSSIADSTIGEALFRQFNEVKTPEARSAFAIALGLARYRDAATKLVETLIQQKHKDELAGYLSI
ncbi:MAG: HEAT repeat domain-containing protein, partial [Planctomycetota bacterium]